ncbi:MAG: hypothetical protein JSR44_13615 [Spirochaetes bacterium]|nr:hypothetical protein [Spirochaetota bacterium]
MAIRELFCADGDITDDLSLMRTAYREGEANRHEKISHRYSRMPKQAKTLPTVAADELALELNSALKTEVRFEPKKHSGCLAEIIPHQKNQNLTIDYLALHDIQIADAGKFFGSELAHECYGLTYAVQVEAKTRDGTILFAQNENKSNLLRITFWNLTATELLTLAFLRNDGDREKFLIACHDATVLMQIAATLEERNGRLANLAYNRALTLARAEHANEEILSAMLRYIEASLKRALVQPAKKAVKDYRALDVNGTGVLDLAHLVIEHKAIRSMLKDILGEGAERLLRMRPRFHSLGLCGILEIVIHEKFTEPAPADLLWQTYLAASAERAVPVLRELYQQALSIGADQETLEIIKKTWLGYKNSSISRREIELK